MFSIVLPTFNRHNLLLRAVESVIEQNYNDWELLVVDDNSTDSTKTWRPNDPRIEVLRLNKNMGPAEARNIGINQASHKWICFLDSDDEWLPNKLQECSEFIQQNPYKIFQSQDIWYNKKKRIYPKKTHKKQSGNILKMATKLCPVSMSSVVVHKTIFEKIGLFNHCYPVCEDYDFWLRAATKFEFGLLDKELVILHSGHKDRVSERKYIFDEWRLKSLIQVLNLVSSDEQKTIIKNEILKKSKILENGYKKYHRTEKLIELKKFNQQLEEH